MKVREKSIAYAAAKNYKTKSCEDILYKEISGLEKELDENTALSDTLFYGREADGIMKEKKTQNAF